MALDLTRFSPNIQQDNRQRQVFSNEGSSIYESLSKVGQGVADIALDVIDRNRKREHADFQTKTTTELHEKETAFDTEWKIKANNGEVVNEEGMNYLQAKNKFLRESITAIEENAPDEGLFSAYKNELEMYRSKRNVQAIQDNYKLGVDASNYKWKEFDDKYSKKFSTVEFDSYAELYNDFMLPEINNLSAETETLSKSEAEKNRKNTLMSFSKIIKDKVSSVDFQRNPVTKVVEDLIPLDIYFSEESRRYNIDFISKLKASGTPEEIENALKNTLELDKHMLKAAKSNLEARYSAGFSGLNESEFKVLYNKIDKKEKSLVESENKFYEYKVSGDQSILEMPSLDIEGELTTAEKKSIQPIASKKAYGVFENLPAEDRIDLFSKILSLKMAQDGESKAGLRARIEDYKKVAEDLGSSKFTFQGLERATGGARAIIDLYKNNKEVLKSDRYIIAGDVYEAAFNKLAYDFLKNPANAKSKGWDLEKAHELAIQLIKDEGAPELALAVESSAVGATNRAKYVAQAETTFRKMQSMANKDPIGWTFFYGSERLKSTMNNTFKNGRLDQGSVVQMNKLMQSEVGDLMLSFNRNRLDQKIMAPFLTAIKTEVENARINGDENYSTIVNNTMMKLEPDMRAAVLEQGLMGDPKDREMFRSIIFRSTFGKEGNEAVMNDVLNANTEPEKVLINQLKSKDSKFKSQSEKGAGKLNSLFNSFYGTKGGINRTSIVSTAATLQNYIDKEIKDNPASEPSDIAQRVFDTFFEGKAAVSSESMRGTIPLNQGETKSAAETKANAELFKLKESIKNGTQKIDLSNLPMTDKVGKVGLEFKTDKALKQFMDMGYTIQFQTPSDSGISRDIVPVLIDQNTGTRYYLRDQNKRPIKRRLP